MSIQNILFIDIETVPQFEILPESGIYTELFKRKFRSIVNVEGGVDSSKWVDVKLLWDEAFEKNAGIYAEFAKVVCISIGGLKGDTFYVKAITSRDEKTLLQEAAKSLLKASTVCGHYIKEFDVPFLFRRFIINELPVPPILNTMGKKPWEISIEDTLEMWGSTQWKYKASLDLLCHVLGIESPKGEMDGSKVAEVWYDSFRVEKDELPFEKEEKAMKKIGAYCNQDVIADARVYCRMKGIPFDFKIVEV